MRVELLRHYSIIAARGQERERAQEVQRAGEEAQERKAVFLQGAPSLAMARVRNPLTAAETLGTPATLRSEAGKHRAERKCVCNTNRICVLV